MIMIRPNTIKKNKSTNIMYIIFSVGLTRTSIYQFPVSSMLLPEINRTDLGIIGVHTLNYLYPFAVIETCKDSMKLLLLPIPTYENGNCKD